MIEENKTIKIGTRYFDAEEFINALVKSRDVKEYNIEEIIIE